MPSTPIPPPFSRASQRPTLADRLFARGDRFLRIALSHYVTNGLSVTLGLVVIMLLVFESAGLAGASSAAVGVMITSLPDVPAPRRRKFMQMLPAPLLGTPLFMLVQLVREDVLLLGVVLAAGTFLAVMLMAWGKRGGPLTFSLLFSMLFSMAAPPVGSLEQILEHGGWFALGAALYLVWGVLTTHWLNTRFRTQLLAECLHSFAQILRTQAQRFAPNADPQSLLARMLEQQATLADHLQNTRDVVLESPTTPARTRLAAMLLGLLEARDHQLACDLDLDTLLKHEGSTATLPALQQVLNTTAQQLEALSLSMLLGRSIQAIAPIADLRTALAGVLPPRPDPAMLVPGPLTTGTPDAMALLHNMADRIGHINDEAMHLAALARGDAAPELAAVRTQWQLFVSPTRWAIAPLLGQLTWRAPTLRYALRATLAVGVGYIVSLHLPWAAHKYWILTTIVVVMRGNLAQTLQRRDARVAGTVLGCLLVMALLATHPGARTLFLVIALGMGLAHAFALRRYLYTTIFATLAGLLQAHILLVGAAPTFAVGERLADTLLGAALAWLFSYVLPAWERSQLPGLVRRSQQAQLQHAKLALALGEPAQTSDLPWRLARREAYDSLSALTLATQRSLAEPSEVRPALAPLEAVQARSYQLLAQLTAVKSLLLLRRAQLDMAVATPALQEAARQIAQELAATAAPKDPPAPSDAPTIVGQPFLPKPDPLLADDLTPWLLRRLTLATSMARELQQASALAQLRQPAAGTAA
ncbi:putative membrane protein YccC [Rhodoferax ferrireducens]|uniref:Membrane protein YccC n=1 Tax=Rhodoferax ferrireducens TaxID=192843 RepID=A0ABU2CEE9_9BURK|nr:FUSC family membrane protein [Rhodoferax ferrireducens]MDR7379698.1 putative membrane protein YccC [Rhodoferax ferrireducens]